MNPEGFKSTMNSLAFGQAMLAAAKDYKQELIDEEKAAREVHDELDMDDLMDDPELERLHGERIAQLKEEAEKRAKQKSWHEKGHGSYREIAEGEFLEIVTKTDRVACHFFHHGFERCKIMDKHLETLARKHIPTRFIKISAPDAQFFTNKLKIRVLPCLVFFVGGVAVDRLTGFDELGKKDNFPTTALEKRMFKCGALTTEKHGEESDDERTAPASSVKRSTLYGKLGSDDESSDFDD